MRQMSLAEANEKAKLLAYTLTCTSGLRNGALIAKLVYKILKREHENQKQKEKK